MKDLLDWLFSEDILPIFLLIVILLSVFFEVRTLYFK